MDGAFARGVAPHVAYLHEGRVSWEFFPRHTSVDIEARCIQDTLGFQKVIQVIQFGCRHFFSISYKKHFFFEHRSTKLDESQTDFAATRLEAEAQRVPRMIANRKQLGPPQAKVLLEQGN